MDIRVIYSGNWTADTLFSIVAKRLYEASMGVEGKSFLETFPTLGEARVDVTLLLGFLESSVEKNEELLRRLRERTNRLYLVQEGLWPVGIENAVDHSFVFREEVSRKHPRSSCVGCIRTISETERASLSKITREKRILVDHKHPTEPDRKHFDMTLSVYDWVRDLGYETVGMINWDHDLRELPEHITPIRSQVESKSFRHEIPRMGILEELAKSEVFIVTHRESYGQTAVEAAELGVKVLYYDWALSESVASSVGGVKFTDKASLAHCLSVRGGRPRLTTPEDALRIILTYASKELGQ